MADNEDENISNVFDLSDEDIDRLSRQIDILIDTQNNTVTDTVTNHPRKAVPVPDIPQTPMKNYELVDEIVERQPINLSVNKPSIIYNSRLNDYYNVYNYAENYRSTATSLYIYKEDASQRFSEHIAYCKSLTFDETFKIEEFNKRHTSKIIYNDQVADVINIFGYLYVEIKIYNIVNDQYYKTSTKKVSILDISEFNVPIKKILDITNNRTEQSKFSLVENVLTNLFEKNWYYIPQNSYTNSYIIHFPKITIRNSNDLTHEIHDIFVRFDVKLHNNILKLTVGSFKGTRTSLSQNEYKSLYRHSHLPKKSNESSNLSFEDFCIGTGQPISLSLTKLTQEIEENEFIGFCLQLEPYLSWESIEGVPFIKMENIINNEEYTPYRETNFNTTNIDINQVTEYITFDKLKYLNYVFEKNHDYTLIVPTEESIESNLRVSEHPNSTIYITSEKQYYVRVNRNTSSRYFQSYIENASFTCINGITKQSALFRPIEIKIQTNLSLTPVINPNIITQIKAYLTNLIN